MPAKSAWLEIDGKFVARALQDALEKLNGAEGEVVLDFSSVHRIDASALRAMESLVSQVDGKAKLALQGVNVSVYKVLKLMKLSRRFSFLH